MEKKDIWLGGSFIFILLIALSFRLAFVNYFDQHELGYFVNGQTGEMYVSEKKGYVVTPPWVFGYTIDLRPRQVCINANERVLNCKLIQFSPKGFKDFIKLHGVDSYIYSSTGTKLGGILKSYAYEGLGREYLFLKINTELGAQSNAQEN